MVLSILIDKGIKEFIIYLRISLTWKAKSFRTRCHFSGVKDGPERVVILCRYGAVFWAPMHGLVVLMSFSCILVLFNCIRILDRVFHLYIRFRMSTITDVSRRNFLYINTKKKFDVLCLF